MVGEDDIIKRMLNAIRSAHSDDTGSEVLNETIASYVTEDTKQEQEKSKDDGIPVTDDPKFGNKTLTNQKRQAEQVIGADFTGFDEPLIFYKNDGDLVFSGKIPDMNGLKFQFRLKDSSGNGCYIWVDGLQLTDDNLLKINRIQGFYKNWKDDLIKNPIF